jgi:hypothetical protein
MGPVMGKGQHKVVHNLPYWKTEILQVFVGEAFPPLYCPSYYPSYCLPYCPPEDLINEPL